MYYEWRKFFTIFIVLLLISIHSLAAYTIGMLFIDEQSNALTILQRLPQSLSQRISSLTLDERLREELQYTRNNDATIAQLKERHTLIKQAKGDASAIITPSVQESTDMSQKQSVDVNWKSIEVLPSLRTALNDPIILSYITQKESLDGLLMVHAKKLGEFILVRISFFQKYSQRITYCYERLHTLFDLPMQLEEMVLSIAQCFSLEPLGALTVVSSVPVSSITLDTITFDHPQFPLVVPAGEYRMHVSAQGYETVSRLVGIEEGTIVESAVEFQRIPTKPILFQGTYKENRVRIFPHTISSIPFVWEDPLLPSLVLIESDGFAEKRYVVKEGRQTVHVSLLPQWAYTSEAVIESQNNLYASLGRTLLLTFGAILSDSLYRSVSSSDQWYRPLSLVTSGAASISFFDTLVQLFAYYQKTRYISQ